MGGTVARRGELTIKREPRSAAETCVRTAPVKDAPVNRAKHRRGIGFGLSIIAATLISTGSVAHGRCLTGQVLASGAPDESLFAEKASRDIRAVWCEEYDEYGQSLRVGPYREHYPSGLLRAEATYVAGQLAGPVVAYFDDGSLFLRGVLSEGEWTGSFSLFHGNGEPWLEAEFDEGRLHGRVATLYPDGGLASETQVQRGREDGLALTFYPQTLGGGRRTETPVEADEFLAAPELHSPTGAIGLTSENATSPPAANALLGDARRAERRE